MRTRTLLGLALWLSACAAAPSPTQTPASGPAERDPNAGPATAPRGSEGPPTGEVESVAIPADLVDEISRASELGRHLFLLDRIAALGTNVLFSNVQDPKSHGVGGYLALPDGGTGGDQFLVSFFTRDDPPRIAYEIRLRPNSKPEFAAFEPAKSATSEFVTLVRARQSAIAALATSPQPINPLVLPAALNGENAILVYLLAGTRSRDVAVLGKHYRFLLPTDASTITTMMPLSNDILEIPTKAPNGATPAALAVTQVVTDFPLETHVLVSLQIELPIFVGTRRGMWKVDGDQISFLGSQIPGSPPAP